MNEDLLLLKDEIEIFNPGLKLLKNPIWISSQENRQAKRHASILIAVENAKQAELAIEKRLCIAGNWLIAEKCKENKTQIQCQNCQKYNHATRNCFAQSVYQICAKQHKTSQHKCNICEVFDQICPHSILKCSNCGEDHKANDSTCLFKTNPEKRSYKYAQNLQKSQQQEQQQQLSTNSFHVLIDNTQNY